MPIHSDDTTRYSRQMALPGIGPAGQKKLTSASVLVVGAGGLGCPALLYLAAAGIGRIGIADGDVIEAENLHRQILFQERDIGRFKTEVAGERLHQINRETDIELHTYWLKNSNASRIIDEYDIVIDGTDNFPARYLINDTCVLREKPFVYGSVYRFEGQLSLFNHGKGRERGPNYRDLFPDPPPAELVPDCSEAGVFGVIPGIIGSMQAAEVIKVITGAGDTLSGKLFLFDAAGFGHRLISIEKREDNPVSGREPVITTLLDDYEAFCSPSNRGEIKEVTPAELTTWIQAGEEMQWIDVRRPEESKQDRMEGTLIPLDEIAAGADKIADNRKVIVYCQSGIRSAKAIRTLENQHGFQNLYNLKGGLNAWKKNKG